MVRHCGPRVRQPRFNPGARRVDPAGLLRARWGIVDCGLRRWPITVAVWGAGPLVSCTVSDVESITMRAEELRQLLDRRPFVPIRLYFTDGTTYDIRHPEMALLTRSTVEIGLPKDQASKIADRVVYCTLLHIVRVENLDGQRM